jgi:mannose-6-phosphate isomerase-like protein (cupin superfamily)
MIAPYINNINKETLDNENYRKVIFTGSHFQLVLMSIQPGEDIGGEVHGEVDQFLRIESGFGKAIIGGKEFLIEDDFAVIIPAGVEHNIINTGDIPLKLYSIYAPPQHKEGTIEKIKENTKIMKKFNVLSFENFVNERLNEAKISSESEFREYAQKVLKNAHGDNFDETKAKETIDGIIAKVDGDFGAAVGILTSSLGK